MKVVDIAVTGEGRLDFQTAMGKAPVGVARLAKKSGPCLRTGISFAVTLFSDHAGSGFTAGAPAIVCSVA